MQTTRHRPQPILELLQKTSRDSLGWTLDGWVKEGESKIISFLNAHAVNMASKNPDFRCVLAQSDVLLRDGIGVKLALKLFKLNPADNLNGTDLIPRILSHYPTVRIAIFGATLEAILIAAEKLKTTQKAVVVSLEHGFHDFEYYCEKAESAKADVIVLCMGMPKQELLAKDLKDKKLAKLVICGGGWADFYSGVKKRAPLWVRQWSLEWVYRLLKEPKRLGRRYTIDILFYFYVILRAKFFS